MKRVRGGRAGIPRAAAAGLASVLAAGLASVLAAGLASVLAAGLASVLAAGLASVPAAALGVAIGGGSAAAKSSGPASGAKPNAHSAGSMKVDDHAKLHLVKSSGSVLYEAGRASGSLPGSIKVRMVVGSSVTATFTISAKDGSISGSGSAKLKSSGTYASFGGSLIVSSGGGHYTHAHGKGSLYGVIDRRTHAVTVTTTGTLYY